MVSHSKEKNAGSRQYPAESLTDVDYAHDLALLENTPAEPKCRLSSWKLAARGIGFAGNTDKTRALKFVF